LQLDLNSDFVDKIGVKVDLVVGIEIIEHLQNPRQFMVNCLNLLRDHGYLMITSPNLESWVSRIRFLRDGQFMWFEKGDDERWGHITPIFSWQIERICRETGATLLEISHTKSKLLWNELCDRLSGLLRNKTVYLGILYPFMRGVKNGEINIFLIRAN